MFNDTHGILFEGGSVMNYNADLGKEFNDFTQQVCRRLRQCEFTYNDIMNNKSSWESHPELHSFPVSGRALHFYAEQDEYNDLFGRNWLVTKRVSLMANEFIDDRNERVSQCYRLCILDLYQLYDRYMNDFTLYKKLNCHKIKVGEVEVPEVWKKLRNEVAHGDSLGSKELMHPSSAENAAQWLIASAYRATDITAKAAKMLFEPDLAKGRSLTEQEWEEWRQFWERHNNEKGV
jgi:hypothetical protein